MDHILSRNCLPRDVIEGKITEVKGVRRIIRRTQLLDDLRNRREYWELKEEAEDRKNGNVSLSFDMEEIKVIFHKSVDLLIIS